MPAQRPQVAYAGARPVGTTEEGLAAGADTSDNWPWECVRQVG